MSDTSLHRVSLSFLADSDENKNNGVINKSPTGGEFTIQLNNSIKIPNSAINGRIITRNVTIWNNSPNLVNTSFQITVAAYNGGAPMTINIPTGLYDINTLNLTIDNTLKSIYTGLPVAPLILFEPSPVDNKCWLRFNFDDTSVDFSITNPINNLLGFDNVVYDNIPEGTPWTILSPNTVNFNFIEYYWIRCANLLSHGIERNNELTGFMARVDVNVGVNEKLIYDPNQEIMVSEPSLSALDNLDRMRFELLDQDENPVDTRGENWCILFEIHYDIPSTHVRSVDISS